MIEEGEALNEVVFPSGGQAEDIALINALGLDVDNHNNLSAAENIPNEDSQTTQEV